MQTKKRGRPANSGFKIPPATAAALHAQGLTYREIASKLGIGMTSVSRLMMAAKAQSVQTHEDRLQRFIEACRGNDRRALDLLDQFEPQDPSTINLDRLGKPPLRFSGRLIREGSTRFIGKEDRKHHDWWDVKIYQVIDGPFRFAVSIEYFSKFKGAVTSQPIAEFTDEPEHFIAAYDPLDALRGWPKLPQYQQRQATLEQTCSLQYEQLVTELTRQPLSP